MTDVDLDALRERYKVVEVPPPPCRVCGRQLTLSAVSAWKVKWACGGRPHKSAEHPDAEGFLAWYRHYIDSEWCESVRGDPEVVRLVDAYERLLKEADRA